MVENKLVEIVIPMMCDCIKDPVVKIEWDKDLSMPPENTQIILPSSVFDSAIAVDKTTNQGYLLNYNETKDKFYWRAA